MDGPAPSMKGFFKKRSKRRGGSGDGVRGKGAERRRAFCANQGVDAVDAPWEQDFHSLIQAV